MHEDTLIFTLLPVDICNVNVQAVNTLKYLSVVMHK